MPQPKNLFDIYTPIEEASRQIFERWNNKCLKSNVIEFVRRVPHVLAHGPAAIYWQNIVTPNVDFLRFRELARLAHLKPVIFEFLNDKFCSKNPQKLAYTKMFFHFGQGRNGGDRLKRRNVVDITWAQGKVFDQITVENGKNLIEFHHELLRSTGCESSLIDISRYYGCRSPNDAYQHVFALTTCCGILFETYLDNDSEIEFCRSVVVPVFREIQDRFGVRPLIVPLYPGRGEPVRMPHWSWYPQELLGLVDELLGNGADNSGRRGSECNEP